MTSAIGRAFISLLGSVCRIAAFPLLVFYFLYRGCRNPRYVRNFIERLGGRPSSFKPTASGSIWLHAVSVGEVISSIRLVQELGARNPTIPLYVSVTTLAGRAIAEEKLGQLVSGIFYSPIDYPFAVRRVLRRIRPAVLVVLETEIWPILYREVKRGDCALVIVNGRISDRAFPRYRRFRAFFRATLAMPDSIFVQSEQDRARYLAIGALEENVAVLGSLKYDAAPPQSSPPKLVSDLIAMLLPDAVWIAASTMPPADSDDVDEDDIVIRAYRELIERHPRLMLILVPRRPERFDEAARRLAAAGLHFVRRSENTIQPGITLPCVLLLDSMGELATLFPLADLVFMGGTFARRGGHNILEPAICRRAIIIGPHMENFPAIAADFRSQHAVLEIENPEDLAGGVDRLLTDESLRRELGARAAELAAKRSGAADAAAAEILKLHDFAIPVWNRPGPSKPILWLFSRFWVAVTRWEQAREVAHARRLSTPVISVGGISMGGTGKTPVVDLLAEKLRSQDLQPAVLTRGYRRKSIEKRIAVSAGATIAARKTGDEPQILIRSGFAHVGIGSDRWKTGRLLEENLKPDIFLLDDGFQHRRLERQLDIVLIDTLNPFDGGSVFPLGGLREPIEALSRADAIVLTRIQPHREYQGIRAKIRSVNPTAPIFSAQVEPKCWINERTRERLAAPPQPVIAFCGLANPSSFWRTLASLGIEPDFRWAFDDHHHYSHRELRRLASHARDRGAAVLLTTEKDAMNLPDRALEVLSPVDLYWLKIGTQLDDEGGLMALIGSKLAKR